MMSDNADHRGGDEQRILVWDFPVRFFHLAFAASFLGAFAIGQWADDHGSLFPVHMLLGGTMVLMVLLRVVWGFVGPRYARFSSFVFGPAEVFSYLRSTMTGGGKRYTGHNPGSSLAIFALLALALGLGVTGAFMAQGGDLMEELHEILAYAMVAVVGVHVAGVLWHTIRHRENLPLSMIDGHKAGKPDGGIRTAHPMLGVLFVALTSLWAYGLARGYNPATNQVTIPILGQTLQLGEDGGHRSRHDDDD
ncbi:MAG TPA: cytochrome b [Planctomycetes bacterium]|nr:cytochrome b [Planctomycetota bacterium]